MDLTQISWNLLPTVPFLAKTGTLSSTVKATADLHATVLVFGEKQHTAVHAAFSERSKHGVPARKPKLRDHLLPTAFSAMTSMALADCGHSGCAIG